MTLPEVQLLVDSKLPSKLSSHPILSKSLFKVINVDYPRVYLECRNCSKQHTRRIYDIQFNESQSCSCVRRNVFDIHSAQAEVDRLASVPLRVSSYTTSGYNIRLDVTCLTCSHEWNTTLATMAYHKTGCPKCSYATNAINRTEYRDLESFQAKLTDKGLDITALSFTSKDERCEVQCNTCQHVWTPMPRWVKGCPACGELVRQQKITESHRFPTHESFQEFLNEVHGEGKITLLEYTPGMQGYSILTCDNPDHYKWKATNSNLVGVKTGCPYCRTFKPYSAGCIAVCDYLDAQGYSMVSAKEGKASEVSIYNAETGKNYYLDGCDIKANLAFEYHGDMWHGNPRLFAVDSTPNPMRPYETAGDCYLRTLKKEKFIRDYGYCLVFLWESEYKAEGWEELIAKRMQDPLTLGEFIVYGKGYWKSYEGDRSLTVADFTDPEIPDGVAYKTGQSLELTSWIYPSTSPEIVSIDPLKIEIHESSAKVTSFWHWDDEQSDYFLYFVRTQVLNSLLHNKMVVIPMEDVEHV